MTDWPAGVAGGPVLVLLTWILLTLVRILSSAIGFSFGVKDALR